MQPLSPIRSYLYLIRKSVEEAGRSVEKAHRRLTTHLNKTDTVKEEEESTSDSNDTDKQEQTLSNQRYSQRPLK